MGVTISALWLLQGMLIFLEIHLAARQVADLEMLALVRSWGSPALILMLWVGFSGLFVGAKAQEKRDEQSETVDKKSSIKTQQPRPTTRTASKKIRNSKAHLSRQKPKKGTDGLETISKHIIDPSVGTKAGHMPIGLTPNNSSLFCRIGSGYPDTSVAKPRSVPPPSARLAAVGL